MKRVLSLSALAAALLFAAPAIAGGPVLELRGAVDIAELDDFGDFGDFGDTFSTTLGVGYRGDMYRVLAEYEWTGAGDDTLALGGYVEFGENAFRPTLGLGGGGYFDPENLSFRDPFGQAYAGVAYYLVPAVAISGGGQYRAPIDALHNGEWRAMGGITVSF